MSTKENFLSSLGVDSTETIDASTLLEDFNLGGEVTIIDPNKDPEPPKPKDENDEPDPAADKGVKFLEEKDDILDLLDAFEVEEEQDTTKKPVEKTEKKPVTKVEKEEESDEINYFEVMAQNLSKIGILDLTPEEGDDDEESEPIEWNEDTFVQKFEESTKKMANNLIEEAFSKHGDKHAEFLWKVAMEGVDPEAYFKAMKSQELVEKFDISTETNQERIMYEYLRMLDPDRTHEELVEEISDLKELNKLDRKAETAKVKLTKYFEQRQEAEVQKAQQEQERREMEKEQFKNTIQQTINTAIQKGDIDNIPFSNDDSSLISYMTETPYKTHDGKPVTELYKDFVEAQQNPESLLKLAKFLKSGLKVDTAIKKAVKQEKEKLWEFKTGTKKKSSSTSRGFLD